MEDWWKGSNVIQLKKTEDVTKQLASKGPCMVVIYAAWCSHCYSLKDPLRELSKTAKVYVIESEDYHGSDARGYPTIKLVKNGEPTDYEGERTPEAMKKALMSGGKRTGRRSRRFRRRTRKAH